MTDKKIIPNDSSELEEFELAIVTAQEEEARIVLEDLRRKKGYEQEYEKKVYVALSRHLGKEITKETLDDTKAPTEIWGKVLDEVEGAADKLIRPSHKILKYSLVRKHPELQLQIPPQKITSPLELLNDRSTTRAFEIVQEYTAENTRRAYNGDLVYWQAWLSAISFSFIKPISMKEVLSFIIQHVEGLDVNIDKMLVSQRFKSKLGPHKLATVKRRIVSLSLFLEQVKWPNPCHEKDIKLLLSRLTKKYGGSKPAGKAITRYILDDMLDTCGDSLRDIRDKAMLLFAWGSGGRRRSEVAAADMKDLTKNPDGDFTYTIPQSKTDQTGKGAPVPLKGRVARALKEWLSAANITEGPIFLAVAKGGNIRGAINGVDVYRTVKIRLKKAGYDETQFGAHSLRSGFVTEAGRRNKPLGDVMALTMHKNVGTVMKYYQAGNIINNSAANLAD